MGQNNECLLKSAGYHTSLGGGGGGGGGRGGGGMLSVADPGFHQGGF